MLLAATAPLLCSVPCPGCCCQQTELAFKKMGVEAVVMSAGAWGIAKHAHKNLGQQSKVLFKSSLVEWLAGMVVCTQDASKSA